METISNKIPIVIKYQIYILTLPWAFESKIRGIFMESKLKVYDSKTLS